MLYAPFTSEATMTLFLNEKHIAQMHEAGLATIDDYISAVEAAYTDQGRGDFEILPRTNFTVDVPGCKRPGTLKIGGGCLKGVRVMGASMYSGGYGGMNLWVTLYDCDTGKVIAILHGSVIGKMKTGATSAMAAKHLSRPESETVGMLGTASQARTQILGLSRVRPIRRLRVFSPNAENRKAFADWARTAIPGLDAIAADSAEATVRNADIVVTVTNSKTPILEAQWLAPGTHCNVIGAHAPGAREIDTATLRRGRVIVDDLDQAFYEKGEILIPLNAGEIEREHVLGAIGEVIAGKLAGRTGADEITMFLSGGTSLEYMGAAAMLAAKAKAAGIGQVLDYEENR